MGILRSVGVLMLLGAAQEKPAKDFDERRSMKNKILQL
jgi:hypothetical protein